VVAVATPGCRGFAEAVVTLAKPPVDGCPVGGSGVAAEVAKIMGVELEVGCERLVALVRCGGGAVLRPRKS